jgi:CheY-like chemotaxis protein
LTEQYNCDYYINMNDSKTPVLLIVEDDEVFIKALQIKFEKENYEVLIGKDGFEGLSIALDKHPDIILLDIIMPKMDGMEMLKKLREDPWGKSTPVVIMTNIGADSNQQINNVIATNPSYYLIKSNTDIEEVVEKVKELLNKKE